MIKQVKFGLAFGIPSLISLAIFAPEASNLHYSQWSAAWVQAVGSILAVGVAIYVPWRISQDAKLAESRKALELRRLSLKSLGHEAGLMREFFMHSHFAVQQGDENAIFDIVGGTAPIDPKSPIVIDYEKFLMLSHMPDEVATFYLNSVSRRFFVISYMRSYYFELKSGASSDDSFNRKKSMEYCLRGLGYCDAILNLVSDEFGGLSFDLTIGGDY